jgi:outer membrane protein assembly factor BamB
LRRLIIITAIATIFASSVIALEKYQDKKMEINFKVPNGWHYLPKPRYDEIAIGHDTIPASVNIKFRQFPEPVTVNAFQQTHMTAYYDGWINMFQRDATKEELRKANVEESLVAVYCKDQLQENLEVKKKMVGEYYYIRGLRGYVISAKTAMGLWSKIQDDIKILVDSFWIGYGARPMVSVEKKDYENWRMLGRDGGNSNYIKTNINLRDRIDAVWKKDFELGSSYEKTLIKPVIGNNSLYFSVNDRVYSMNAQNGNINWEYRVGEIKNSFVFNEDILFFIKEGRPAYLYAVMSQNGGVLYKKQISENHSDPIIDNNKLYIIEDTKLVVRDSETGVDLWSRDYSLDHTVFPVVSGNCIASIERDGALVVTTVSDGEIRWRRQLKSKILGSPVISGSKLLVTLEQNSVQKELIKVFDLRIGSAEWGFEYEEFEKVVASPSAGENYFIAKFKQKDAVSIGQDSKDVLIAFNSENGEKLWEKQTGSVSTDIMRPLATNQLIMLNGQEKGEKKIFWLDAATGEIYRSENQELFIKPELETGQVKVKKIVDIKPYKDTVITIEVEGYNLSVVCRK